MKDEVFRELFKIIRRKNGELVLYSRQYSRQLLENLGWNVIQHVKLLQRNVKKEKDIKDISVQLLHDTFLIGLILEGKESRKNIYKEIQYYDVYDTIQIQTRHVVNRVKCFITWSSLYNYVRFTEKILGLLFKISFDFNQLIPLIREAKGYRVDDFYRRADLF